MFHFKKFLEDMAGIIKFDENNEAIASQQIDLSRDKSQGKEHKKFGPSY